MHVEPVEWAMEDHAVAMEARLAAIGELSGHLRATTEGVYKAL